MWEPLWNIMYNYSYLQKLTTHTATYDKERNIVFYMDENKKLLYLTQTTKWSWLLCFTNILYPTKNIFLSVNEVIQYFLKPIVVLQTNRLVMNIWINCTFINGHSHNK